MTQSDFGAYMGRSRRWVQDLEAGLRQSDPRVSVVEDAARVLDVPIEVLLTDDPVGRPRECIDQTELAALRAAVQGIDVLTGTSAADHLPATAEELGRRLVHARGAFQAGAFASLGTVVPDLLRDTNHAVALAEGEDERARLLRLFALVLDVVEAAAIKYGDADLALIAGHRAVAAAARAGDPVVMASSARHLADAMAHTGQPQAAARLAVDVATRLGAQLRQLGPDGLSVLGMLYLKASFAEATAGASTSPTAASSARAVPALLAQADEHARELGRDDNRMWTAYGPTNVGVHRVSAHVRLSEGAEAIAAAEAIPEVRRAALPRERRAHLLTDLAHGLTQAGLRQQAVETLLAAEREAAEEVRCRPRTRQLIEQIRLLGAGAADRRLRELAARCGISA